MTNNITELLADPKREVVALSIITGSLLLIGDQATRVLLDRELRGAPVDLMADPLNQAIWAACRDMVTARRIPTVTDLQMRPELQHVPPARWEQIDTETAGANLGEHLAQLARTARTRVVVQASQRMLQAVVAGEDVAEAVTACKADLTQGMTMGGAARIRRAGEFRSSGDAARARAVGAQRTYSTGIKLLDAQLGGGIVPGKLMLFAAPSGRGKTRFGLRMALANALQGERSLYVSGEMKGEAVAQLGEDGRPVVDPQGEMVEDESHEIYVGLESMAAGVTRSGKGKAVPAEQLVELDAAHRWLAESDLISVYDDAITLDVLTTLAYECRDSGVGLMILDNLTHVEQTGRKILDEHVWYKQAAERIAAIARETRVSIVALLQPSSNENISAGRAPREHELGASRAVIHGAAYVVTAGRDLDSVQEAWRRGDAMTDAQLRVLKCRHHGGPGVLDIKWSDRYGLWFGEGDGQPGPVVDLTEWRELPEVPESNQPQLLGVDA